MAKTIVIGDIHGCYNELKRMMRRLRRKGDYNKETDKLIFLGDYIDRGEDSRKVINYIKQLQKENKNVIALMGNHEDMAIQYYNAYNRNDYLWLCNGGNTTLDSYYGHEKQLYKDIDWMRSLPLYYEDEHFIYVHAGIDIDKPMNKQNKHTLLWIREDFIYNEKKYNKRVVFGHTPTMLLTDKYKPLYTPNKNIDIDTGCVFGGCLTALVIEDGEIKKFHQVEKVSNKN